MEQPSLDSASMRSPYADQLRQGFARLRFTPLLEKQFRDIFLAHSQKRGRLSGVIALILVFVVASIDLAFGKSQVHAQLDVLCLSVLAPGLLASVVLMSLPLAQRWYTQIAGIGVVAAGLIVTYMCHIAALGGESYFMAGQELVLVYAYLFLGLMFNVATVVGSLLVIAHVVIGLVLGLPAEEMLYMTAVLVATAVIASNSMYKLEHALRMSFLETCLLHEAAEHDGMTSLYNRRIFDDYVRRLWRQSHREGCSLEIILVDIDFFKIYNDLYGHQAGDDCLKKVAETIGQCAKRPFDFAARYGGEEFVLVLYGPPEEYGRTVPEQIRREVMALAIAHNGSSAENVVTVSVGVALDLPRSSRSLTGAIQVADEALYQAKQQGRNRVVFKTTTDDEVETGNFRTAFWKSA